LTKASETCGSKPFRSMGWYGLDGSARCRLGLELTINWLTNGMHVFMAGDKVTIDRTVYADDLAPEVLNAIEVFNQAVIEECLRTK
jgi:hypothetical protein